MSALRDAAAHCSFRQTSLVFRCRSCNSVFHILWDCPETSHRRSRGPYNDVVLDWLCVGVGLVLYILPVEV